MYNMSNIGQNMSNIQQIQLYLSNQTWTGLLLMSKLLSNYIYQFIHQFQSCQKSNISNMGENISNIGQIQLYLTKQATDRADFGIKMAI